MAHYCTDEVLNKMASQGTHMMVVHNATQSVSLGLHMVLTSIVEQKSTGSICLSVNGHYWQIFCQK